MVTTVVAIKLEHPAAPDSQRVKLVGCWFTSILLSNRRNTRRVEIESTITRDTIVPSSFELRSGDGRQVKMTFDAAYPNRTVSAGRQNSRSPIVPLEPLGQHIPPLSHFRWIHFFLRAASIEMEHLW
jgi:hypothetical protein